MEITSSKETDSIIKIDKLNEFQQRVMNEYYELLEKHEKLAIFLEGAPTVGADEIDRLQRQRGIMWDYIDVLQDRVMHFEQDPSVL